MLQKLCLCKKKTQVVFFSFLATLSFYLTNALVYVNIDQGIHKVKLKVARNEKQKNYVSFLFL